MLSMYFPVSRTIVSRSIFSRTFASSGALCNISIPNNLSDGERQIWQKLHSAFQPTRLAVQDVSGGCGSFYAINVASRAFEGLSIVKQHKLVNEALKAEIADIHGIQVKTSIE